MPWKKTDIMTEKERFVILPNRRGQAEQKRSDAEYKNTPVS
jgi:hypothetical protein